MNHHAPPHRRALALAALLTLAALQAPAQPPGEAVELAPEAVMELEPADRFGIVRPTFQPAFGNTFCPGGKSDLFKPPLEPATPSQAMLDGCVAPSFDFDQPSKNGHCFGHVFEGCVPAGCRIDRLHLLTRLKRDGDIPSNDSLSLVDAVTNQSFWSSQISDLDPTWPNGGAVTLSLAIPGPYPENGIGLILQDDTRIDFAYLRVSYDCRARVCGRKHHDRNCNGRVEDGEAPLPGWTVVATGPAGSDSATTDADGRYCLYLPPGKYSVGELARPGWAQTRPGGSGRHEIEVSRGQVIDDLDFANCRCEENGGTRSRR